MGRKTFKVNSLADSGKGSLRSALICANKDDGVDIIFNVAGVIILSSPLPIIRREVNIDGNGVIEIDFNQNTGLVIDAKAANSVIQNLSLTNSSGNGLTINGNAVEVYGNRIGIDLNGTARGNEGDGIYVSTDVTGVIIGSNPDNVSGQPSNIISNNGLNGIQLNGAIQTTIVSNFIGTNIAGTVAMPNAINGIYLLNASQNIIGGTVYTNSDGVTNDPTGTKGTVAIVYIFPPLGNLISGNTINGVFMNLSSGNTLYGNFIGVDVSGITALGNGGDGVLIQESNSNSMIGCLVNQNPFVYYNVCSGNVNNGIHVHNSTNTKIQGNFAGIGANNASVIPNGDNGVLVDGNSTRTIIGGIIPLGNVFSGNTIDGLAVIDTASDLISFNTFNGIFAFVGAAPNGRNGTYISSTGGLIVLRTCVISGNTLHGVHVQNSNGVIIEEIIVGLNTGGTAAIPNGGDGLLISGDSHANFIGRNVPSVIPRNAFSGNTGNGVHITDTAHDNLITMSFIGLSVSGLTLIGNTQNGVLIDGDAYNNFVGTLLAPISIYTNFIGDNGGYGVLLTEDCTSNIVTNNFIDVNVLLQAAPNTLGPTSDTSTGTNIIVGNLP